MHRNVVQFSSRKTNNSISTQMNETEKYDEKQIINKRKSFCTQNAKSTEYQIGNATQAQWGQIYLFLRAFAALRSQTPGPPPPSCCCRDAILFRFYSFRFSPRNKLEAQQDRPSCFVYVWTNCGNKFTGKQYKTPSAN